MREMTVIGSVQRYSAVVIRDIARSLRKHEGYLICFRKSTSLIERVFTYNHWLAAYATPSHFPRTLRIPCLTNRRHSHYEMPDLQSMSTPAFSHDNRQITSTLLIF